MLVTVWWPRAMATAYSTSSNSYYYDALQGENAGVHIFFL